MSLRTRLGTVLVGIVAAILGAFVVFFTAGPALFADGGGAASRLVIVPPGALVLGVVGLALGLAVPSRWRVVALALAAPVLPVVIFFESAGNPDPVGFWVLGLAFVVGYFAAALGGAFLGMRLRRRRG